MHLQKNKKFDQKEAEVARLFKALSHPARISILKLLAQKQTCVCGSIVNELPLSQSTVSQHLKELKLAGLIKGAIDGPKVCYCINIETWEKLKIFSQDFFNFIDTSNQITC